MNSPASVVLTPPRFVDHPALVLAGIAERYRCDATAGIPEQWRRFAPFLGKVPGQIGATAYGAMYDFDRDISFTYLCGVEVGTNTGLPAGMTSLQVAAHRYAVFSLRGHVSEIKAAFAAIRDQWLPGADCQPADAPCFELYGEEFNAQAGSGLIELWLPIRS